MKPVGKYIFQPTPQTPEHTKVDIILFPRLRHTVLTSTLSSIWTSVQGAIGFTGNDIREIETEEK